MSGYGRNVASASWDAVLQRTHIISMLNEGSPRQIYEQDHASLYGCPNEGPLRHETIASLTDAVCYSRLKHLIDGDNCVTHATHCVERTQDGWLHVHVSIHLNKRVKRNAAQKIFEVFAKNLHVEPIANLWLCWLYKLKGNCNWKECYNKLAMDFPMCSDIEPETVSQHLDSKFPDWQNNSTDFNTLLQFCKIALIDEEGNPFGRNCNASVISAGPENYHIIDGDFQQFDDQNLPFTLPKTGRAYRIGGAQGPNKRKHSETTSPDDDWIEKVKNMTIAFIEDAKVDNTKTLRHLMQKLEDMKEALFFNDKVNGILNTSKWNSLKDMCATHCTRELDKMREKKGSVYIYEHFKDIFPHYSEWCDQEDEKILWNMQVVGPSGDGKTYAFEELLKQTGSDPYCPLTVWRSLFRNNTFSGFGYVPGQQILCMEEVPPNMIRHWYKDILQCAETAPWDCRKAHSSDGHRVTAGALFYVNTLPILIVYLRYVQEIETHNGFDAGLDPQQLNRRFQRMRIVYKHDDEPDDSVNDLYLKQGKDGAWRSFVDAEHSFVMKDGKWYLHERTLRKILDAGAINMLTKPRSEGGWDVDPLTGELNPALPSFLAQQAGET